MSKAQEGSAPAKDRILSSLQMASGDFDSPGVHQILALATYDVSPYAVYLLLRKRFGPPNVNLKGGGAWGWALQAPQGILGVYHFFGGWQIGCVSDGPASPGLREDASSLMNDIRELATEPKNPPKGSIVGGVVTNPYRIYLETANETLRASREVFGQMVKEHDAGVVSAEEPIPPSLPVPSDMIRYLNELSGRGPLRDALLTSSVISYVLSLEGFLNLVYHLFIRPELADQRMREKIQREPLDLKLRLIGVYCDCFDVEPVDRDDELFKAFCHLTDLRTNLAHAKLTTSMEETIVIEEQKYPFLVARPNAGVKYGISTSLTGLNEEMVQRVERIAWGVVSSLLRAMKPEVKYSFGVVHFYKRIEYERREDGTVEIRLIEDDARVPAETIDEMLETGVIDWSSEFENN